MTMTKELEIKTCWHCGSESIVHPAPGERTHYRSAWVSCPECGACGPVVVSERPDRSDASLVREAVAAWNERI